VIRRLLAPVCRLVALLTALDDPNRRGNSYAVTLMTPIEPERVEDLRALLASFGVGPESPLAGVPHVHFARWVVVDQLKTAWEGAPRVPPRLTSPYLLFTADVTAPEGAAAELPESFYRDLAGRMPDAADAVWSHCLGYPGTEDGDAFLKYLAASQLDASLYFAAFPDVTVDEIRHALDVRDALVTFVQTRQGMRRPHVLRREYLEAADSWFN
jgi:hypothetical protein